MAKKIKFDRATTLGWVPVEGISIGHLAVAEFSDDELSPSEWGVFHPITGTQIPTNHVILNKELAVSLAKTVGSLPDWVKIKRGKSNDPKDVVISKAVKTTLSRAVSRVVSKWMEV
jgi:hypothetical protein